MDTTDVGPVTLRWRGEEVEGIRLSNDWRSTMSPVELLQEVERQFQEGRPNRVPWRNRVRLRGISLDDMQELVDALRAARREEPPNEPTTRTTRHLSARWSGSMLLGLRGDLAWLDRAPVQSIADEVVQVLDTPPGTEGPAVRRLMKMMESAA